MIEGFNFIYLHLGGNGDASVDAVRHRPNAGSQLQGCHAQKLGLTGC
jgi:hypothetical protein